MIRISWCLVDIVSRALNSDEREVVLGDFAESGETGGRALRGLLGLIARGQAALWKDWRSWLVLFGLVGPVGILLLGFSLFFSGECHLYSWIIQNYGIIDPAALEETGLTLRRGIPVLVCHFFLLLSWSWTGGFALASLSRGTIWINGALLCAGWLLFAVGVTRPPKISVIVVLLPFLWGVCQGLRFGTLKLRQAIFVATAIAGITALAIWIGGWWRGGTWQTRQLLLSLVLSWPAWYLLAAAISRRQINTVRI